MLGYHDSRAVVINKTRSPVEKTTTTTKNNFLYVNNIRVSVFYCPSKMMEAMFFYFSFRYSRKIMWLEVAHTNNDPCVVGNYFVECVEQIGG